ncbi:unnamed protein product [Moneuplotes crassus]|uniref:Uncharacterized protein n=1 Tax=Euplotes crassus TaxID=5936 RepID=A0AAD1U8S6_EUPCR|nr:unnamed protein product [Moneuplotes crassus]
MENYSQNERNRKVQCLIDEIITLADEVHAGYEEQIGVTQAFNSKQDIILAGLRSLNKYHMSKEDKLEYIDNYSSFRESCDESISSINIYDLSDLETGQFTLCSGDSHIMINQYEDIQAIGEEDDSKLQWRRTRIVYQENKKDPVGMEVYFLRCLPKENLILRIHECSKKSVPIDQLEIAMTKSTLGEIIDFMNKKSIGYCMWKCKDQRAKNGKSIMEELRICYSDQLKDPSSSLFSSKFSSEGSSFLASQERSQVFQELSVEEESNPESSPVPLEYEFCRYRFINQHCTYRCIDNKNFAQRVKDAVIGIIVPENHQSDQTSHVYIRFQVPDLQEVEMMIIQNNGATEEALDVMKQFYLEQCYSCADLEMYLDSDSIFFALLEKAKIGDQEQVIHLFSIAD